MQNERKNKHMTLQNRLEIQECLSKGMTFKAIAKKIGKSPTTIFREVKHHSAIHRNGLVKTEETYPLLLKAPFVCNGYTPMHISSAGINRSSTEYYWWRLVKVSR